MQKIVAHDFRYDPHISDAQTYDCWMLSMWMLQKIHNN